MHHQENCGLWNQTWAEAEPDDMLGHCIHPDVSEEQKQSNRQLCSSRLCNNHKVGQTTPGYGAGAVSVQRSSQTDRYLYFWGNLSLLALVSIFKPSVQVLIQTHRLLGLKRSFEIIQFYLPCHFLAKFTKAQRRVLNSPRSHSWLEARLPDFQTWTLSYFVFYLSSQKLQILYSCTKHYS